MDFVNFTLKNIFIDNIYLMFDSKTIIIVNRELLFQELK